MAETKTFDPAALASIASGILLVDFSAMAEASEYIMGHGIWTHQYPSLAGKLKEKVLEQFPDMPHEIIEDGWEGLRDRVREQYGETVEVKKGSEEEISPLDPEHMPQAWKG